MKPFYSALIFIGLFLAFPAEAESLSAGGPYGVGETITIQGDTNYNTDNKVLVEIYPASFGPSRKYEPSMSGGGTIIVPVVKKESGLFSWSAKMSTSGWGPDQYMIRTEVIGKDYLETALVTLTDNRSYEMNTSGSSFQGEENLSSILPFKELMPTMTPMSTDLPTLNQSPAPVQTTHPAQTQTHQSPFSCGAIISSLLVAGVFIEMNRR